MQVYCIWLFKSNGIHIIYESEIQCVPLAYWRGVILQVWFYLDWLDLAIIDNYTCIGLMYNIKLKQESLTKECYKIGLSWENLLGVVLLLEC